MTEPRRGEIWWVPKSHLVERQCTLGPARLSEACAALRTAVDC